MQLCFIITLTNGYRSQIKNSKPLGSGNAD